MGQGRRFSAAVVEPLEAKRLLAAHYYGFTTSAGTWEQAELQAIQYGGHLVSITDQAEQDFINDYFVEPYSSDAYWTGLTDKASEGTFRWTTGEPVTYGNWKFGEPNDLWGEDYVSLNWSHVYRGAAALGEWNDEPVGGVDGSVSIFSEGDPAPHWGIIEFSSPPVNFPGTLTAFEADADDQIVEARALNAVDKTKSAADSIDVGTDVDVYSISVTKEQRVSFDIDTLTNGPPGLGSYLRVFNKAGSQLASNNDAAAPREEVLGFDSYLEYTFTETGTYYVAVSSWQNTAYNAISGGGDYLTPSAGTGTYTLKVSTVGFAGTIEKKFVPLLPSSSPISVARYLGEPIDSTKETWVLSHGWNSSRSEMNELATAITLNRKDAQILTLDWSKAAKSVFTRADLAERWIPTVGAWGQSALARLKFAPGKLNFIGHSFGSYVSWEMANRFSADVNSLVALDPAADIYGLPITTFGGQYVSSKVDFKTRTKVAWTFHSSLTAGSQKAAETGDEAIVTQIGSNVYNNHTRVVDLFTRMINQTDAVSKQFSLSRLLNRSTGPWVTNQYARSGSFAPGEAFEAVLETDSTGKSPKLLRYFSKTRKSNVMINAGLIYGQVINDRNGNGRLDTGEGRLANWLVFLDANKDGHYQSGERSSLTDATGNWRLEDLPAGSYRVRELRRPFWEVTSPASAFHDVSLSSRLQFVCYFFNDQIL